MKLLTLSKVQKCLGNVEWLPLLFFLVSEGNETLKKAEDCVTLSNNLTLVREFNTYDSLNRVFKMFSSLLFEL